MNDEGEGGENEGIGGKEEGGREEREVKKKGGPIFRLSSLPQVQVVRDDK